jgi:hypothetical protein
MDIQHVDRICVVRSLVFLVSFFVLFRGHRVVMRPSL